MFWRKHRNASLPAVEGMTDQQIDEALADTNAQHPLFQAMLTLVQRRIIEETQESLDPKLPEKETHFALGGVRSLAELRNEIAERRGEEIKRRNREAGKPKGK